jgi:sugar phosphate isomerase/epimerase
MIRSLSFSLVALALFALAPAHAAEPIPDAYKIGGFAIGCQAYSFNRYSVFEAIEKTAEVGAKVIEFYPGQKLTPDDTTKWGHDAPPEAVATVKEKLKKHGIIAVAYGVVGLPKDEAGCRKVFEFAKTMGIRVINTESVDSIDTFEPLVKEYDIKVGFHDHPKREKDPNYKMWDPNYILSVVEKRDKRIGSCADTGHWQRSGLDPVECVKILKGHIVSSHLKDLVAGDDGKGGMHDVPYGTGKGKIAETLAEFKAQGFTGPISVEYEYKWTESVPEIKECIDFVRKLGSK